MTLDDIDDSNLQILSGICMGITLSETPKYWQLSYIPIRDSRSNALPLDLKAISWLTTGYCKVKLPFAISGLWWRKIICLQQTLNWTKASGNASHVIEALWSNLLEPAYEVSWINPAPFNFRDRIGQVVTDLWIHSRSGITTYLNICCTNLIRFKDIPKNRLSRGFGHKPGPDEA